MLRVVFLVDFSTNFLLEAGTQEGRPMFQNIVSGKPICEPLITLVASSLPTFYRLPLAKCAAFA
jgi:hypothetical protein